MAGRIDQRRGGIGRRVNPGGFLRGLTLVVAVAFALSSLLHAAGPHATAAHLHGAAAEPTAVDMASAPCDHGDLHPGGACTASAVCALCAPVVAWPVVEGPATRAVALSADATPHGAGPAPSFRPPRPVEIA